MYRHLTELRFGLDERWGIVACRACGTHLTWPQPLPAHLERLYFDHYLPLNYVVPDVAKIQAAVAAHQVGGSMLRDQWTLARSTEIPALLLGAPTAEFFRNHHRVLDVGAYTGENMAWLRAAGWDTVGVEPNPKAASVARSIGLDVEAGYVEQADFPAGSFDAIYLSYVVEHAPCPGSLLARLFQLLRPGGRLLLTTHNVGSLWRQVFGPTWIHWHTPFHLVHTDTRSLTLLARSAGFRTISVQTRTPTFWLLMSLRATRDTLRRRPVHERLYDPVSQSTVAKLIHLLRFDGTKLPGDCTIAVFERPLTQ